MSNNTQPKMGAINQHQAFTDTLAELDKKLGWGSISSNGKRWSDLMEEEQEDSDESSTCKAITEHKKAATSQVRFNEAVEVRTFGKDSSPDSFPKGNKAVEVSVTELTETESSQLQPKKKTVKAWKNKGKRVGKN